MCDDVCICVMICEMCDYMCEVCEVCVIEVCV